MSPHKGNYVPHSHSDDVLRRFESDRRQTKDHVFGRIILRFALAALLAGALVYLISLYSS